MGERRHFSIVDTALDQDKKIFEADLGERKVIPFTGGEIIYAVASYGERVVIKKPLRSDQARREWNGLNIAYATGISVPRPIALVKYDDSQLALVSSFVKGDTLYDYPDSTVKYEVGRQIRLMHHKARISGELWKSSGRSTFVYYDKHLFDWTRSDLEELRPDRQTVLLLNELTDNMEQFCGWTKPTFNHNDLHDGQIMVGVDRSPTIIDFGNWAEETWINEISYHLFHLIRTDRVDTDDFLFFVNGYQEGEGFTDTEKSNMVFYLLFISSRALAYFYTSGSAYLPIARETHNKVLKHINNEEPWKIF